MAMTKETIEQRNTRVEADKAWELSWTRRVVIAFGTYVVIVGYLSLLNVENAWLHAFVPPVAYILSTLSLPVFKSLWLARIYKC